MTVALSGRPDSCSIDCSSGKNTTQHFCVCEAAEAARCARGGLLPMPGTALLTRTRLPLLLIKISTL